MAEPAYFPAPTPLRDVPLYRRDVSRGCRCLRHCHLQHILHLYFRQDPRVWKAQGDRYHIQDAAVHRAGRNRLSCGFAVSAIGDLAAASSPMRMVFGWLALAGDAGLYGSRLDSCVFGGVHFHQKTDEAGRQGIPCGSDPGHSIFRLLPWPLLPASSNAGCHPGALMDQLSAKSQKGSADTGFIGLCGCVVVDGCVHLFAILFQ